MAFKKDVALYTNKMDIVQTGDSIVGATLGDGQHWVHQTRTVDVDYTNSSGRPILLQVTYSLNGFSPGLRFVLYLDGVWFSNTQAQAAVPYGTLKAIIPPGSTYKISSGEGSSTIVQWSELIANTTVVPSVINRGAKLDGILPNEISKLASVGFAQTWSPSGKTIGTTYTNTTGRSMAVSISWSWLTINKFASVTVDGVLAAYGTSGGLSVLAQSDNSLWTIIPPGSSYVVDAAPGGSGYWFELTGSDQLVEPVGENGSTISPIGLTDGSPASSLGIAQTWHDVTGSRTYNVNYTNAGERPIAVSGSVQFADLGATLNVIVDGVSTLLDYCQVVGQWVPFTTVVPAGNTYQLAVSHAPNALAWSELS